MLPVSAISEARRRHTILKALVERERTYTRGYRDLSRLFDLHILEPGLKGDAREIAETTLDDLSRAVDMLGFIDM